MADFFHMGGYAPYVWSSFAISFVLLLIHFLQSSNYDKKMRIEIKRQFKQTQMQQQQKESPL